MQGPRFHLWSRKLILHAATKSLHAANINKKILHAKWGSKIQSAALRPSAAK